MPDFGEKGVSTSFSLSQPVVGHVPLQKVRRHTGFQRLCHIWPATARVHRRGAESQYVEVRERNGYPPGEKKVHRGSKLCDRSGFETFLRIAHRRPDGQSV